jgi:hypothetical protein
MFKRLTAILVLVALLSSGFSRFFVYAGFALNKDYIANNLCVNRDKPWLHCNGRCFFMKKIKQAEENEKKQNARDNLNRLEISFFCGPFRFKFHEAKILEDKPNSFPNYTYQYTSHYIEAVFRPPKCVA